MFAYLTITAGQRAGSSVLLDHTKKTRIGRGAECTLMLTDALCSRVHAIISCENGAWWVRDAQSRNGTFVNGQKVDEAALDDNHRIRVGATEFLFHQSEQPPTVGPMADFSMTQTLIKDTRLGVADGEAFAVAAIHDSDQSKELLLLYQLCIRLLGCRDPNELMRVSLDLLRERTEASVAGFLWISDDGKLKPKLVIPEKSSAPVTLSESLTRLVCDEGHAVWIANQHADAAEDALQHYADAICVPLLSRRGALGAIHIYLEQGRFRQSHFDFAISVANITTVALVRARKEETLESDLARLKAKTAGYDEIIGESPSIRDLKDKMNRMSRATGCVLVRGESGTGKELVARALHRASPRADRPMLSINCAAIPADLMESQLFGHKAGSFTGAERDHTGLFQQADLGTLFLDEIGELTLHGQSKMLRILEGHPFLPVGGTTEIQVDVRVIAATNRDLLAYVAEKKFREDLYYRLSVFELVVPPLRDRDGDVALLIDYFLDHFRKQHGRPGLAISPEARNKLLTAPWPGNVRQLRNVIDSAVVLAAGERIEAADLGLRDATQGALDSLRIDHWERKLIMEALARAGGSVPEAARLLGIGRATLYRKLEEYDIPR
ncbi:MAG TPA: sigma 54-interacting transcriptional regulator [Pirellulales bacterium]|nr:sigma 54-interacting transcriptional regulator [Pirellulales bacterium]